MLKVLPAPLGYIPLTLIMRVSSLGRLSLRRWGAIARCGCVSVGVGTVFFLIVVAAEGFAFVGFLEPELPRLNIAGHFLCWCKESNQRKHPFFSRWMLSADSTSVLLTADRAHPCARSPSLQAGK